eukprot:gene15733-33221_t
MQANLYALGAIALWASLASLGVSLTHIPPFLLTGIALVIGSIPAWPFVLRDPSQWRIPLRTLALGVYGLFAYHFLLFIALRHAPAVEANLVNYLWPLFIVRSLPHVGDTARSKSKPLADQISSSALATAVVWCFAPLALVWHTQSAIFLAAAIALSAAAAAWMAR